MEGISRPNAPVTERGLKIAPEPPRMRRWPMTPAVLTRYGDCERAIVENGLGGDLYCLGSLKLRNE